MLLVIDPVFMEVLEPTELKHGICCMELFLNLKGWYVCVWQMYSLMKKKLKDKLIIFEVMIKEKAFWTLLRFQSNLSGEVKDISRQEHQI